MSRPISFQGPRERSFVMNRCHCGCGAYASWGFPGNLWFTREHIPAALLAAPEPLPPAAPAIRQPNPTPPALDLFESAPIDWGFRPTSGLRTNE